MHCINFGVLFRAISTDSIRGEPDFKCNMRDFLIDGDPDKLQLGVKTQPKT